MAKSTPNAIRLGRLKARQQPPDLMAPLPGRPSSLGVGVEAVRAIGRRGKWPMTHGPHAEALHYAAWYVATVACTRRAVGQVWPCAECRLQAERLVRRLAASLTERCEDGQKSTAKSRQKSRGGSRRKS